MSLHETRYIGRMESHSNSIHAVLEETESFLSFLEEKYLGDDKYDSGWLSTDCHG